MITLEILCKTKKKKQYRFILLRFILDFIFYLAIVILFNMTSTFSNLI